MPIVPSDADGALSTGTGLNYLFADPRVGDEAVFTLACEEGAHDPGFTLGGVAGIAYSMDGETWGEDGADLAGLHVTSEGVTIHARCVSVQTTPRLLAIDSSGLVSTTTDVTAAAPALSLAAALLAPAVSAVRSVAVEAPSLEAAFALHGPAVSSGGSVTVAADVLPLSAVLHAPTAEAGTALAAPALSLTATLHQASVEVAASAAPVTKTLSLLPTISTSPLDVRSLVDGPSSGTGGPWVLEWMGGEAIAAWSVDYSIVVLNAAGTSVLRQVKAPVVVKSGSAAYGPASVQKSDQAIPAGNVTASERYAIKVTGTCGEESLSLYFALPAGVSPPAQSAAWVGLTVRAFNEWDWNEDLYEEGWLSVLAIDYGDSKGQMHFSEGW